MRRQEWSGPLGLVTACLPCNQLNQPLSLCPSTRFYSVNVPLDNGIDDDSYEDLFKPIMTRVMEVYQPGAIVMQSGEGGKAR